MLQKNPFFYCHHVIHYQYTGQLSVGNVTVSYSQLTNDLQINRFGIEKLQVASNINYVFNYCFTNLLSRRLAEYGFLDTAYKSAQIHSRLGEIRDLLLSQSHSRDRVKLKKFGKK